MNRSKGARLPLLGLRGCALVATLIVWSGCGGTTSTITYVDPHHPVGSFRTAWKGSIADTADEARFVASSFDLSVVVNQDSAGLAELHAMNPYAVVYTYQKIAGLHAPDDVAPAGDPGWRAVENQDLLWYGTSGKAVTNTQFGWYHVDILDSAKRAAWTRILIANIQSDLALGYDAVFLDNVGIIHSDLITELPASYTQAAYYQAVGEVLAAVRAALPGHPIVVNSYTGVADPGKRGLELLADADGLYFEGFSMKTSLQPVPDGDRYQQQLDDFVAALGAGKAAIALDYGLVGDLERRLFSVASLLLVTDTHAYHSYSAADAGSDLQQYPEDSLNIGTPLAKRERRQTGVVVREFTGGTVLTNPTPIEVAYELGAGNWARVVLSGGGAYPNPGSISWEPIAGSTLRLAPGSAVIARPG